MNVTLCGPARFAEDFVEANRALSLRGFVVFPLSSPPEEKDKLSPYEKTMLDLVHLAKISSSDAIVILGDGYIGRSTATECLWAHINQKTIVCQFDCLTATGDATDWDRVAASLHNGTLTGNIITKSRAALKAVDNV